MDWIPCSGLEEVDGMVWLKRMIQKARRLEESRAAGRDLMNGYLFGDNDFVDGKVLRFLGVSDKAVLQAVRSEADDDAAARGVVDRSGRSAAECAAFSRRLAKSMANFALMEADEGRLPPGIRRALIAFFYNRVMMPLVYAQFHAAERRRGTQG